MLTNYSSWIGKPVIVNVANGTSEVALRCILLSEFDGRVRVRIRDTWDVDIYKEMIDGIESDTGSVQAQLANLFEP